MMSEMKVRLIKIGMKLNYDYMYSKHPKEGNGKNNLRTMLVTTVSIDNMVVTVINIIQIRDTYV